MIGTWKRPTPPHNATTTTTWPDAPCASAIGGRNAALAAPGDTLLATSDGAVTILLRVTNYGLLMERTLRQGAGMRLVQTMVFSDVKTFDHWCAVEPLRFEDGLLFSKLVREGHAAFAENH